ncbi:MAG: hypothetical protein ACR2P3_02690 [Geminicoccaceae bacterium]
MSDTDTLASTGDPGSTVIAPPANGAADQGPLDLRELEVHFPGYEIVDPVTVALRPVTIATPSARTVMEAR